ncbi:unnamed protein product [Aureobasidium pullulans]|nr:unnamed protein product [Aureobasidium pullulans]
MHNLSNFIVVLRQATTTRPTTFLRATTTTTTTTSSTNFLCLASIACNGPRFIKKLKSMAKGLAKKIAGALKAAKDQYVSGSSRSLIAPGAYYHRNKTSNEATRRSPTASPAIRPRTRSEEKDEKERARLPRTTPAVRRMALDD